MGIISSLIGGAFDLIGQGKANRANKKINATNNEFNAKQAQLARDWQEEQYNKYSSPSALVRQYEEAGLNPALVAGVGQGTTFTGSSASAASPIAMQNPFGNVGLEVASHIEAIKNNKSLRDLQAEQAETEDAKQRNLDSDTAGKDIENQFKPELLKQNLQQGELNLENTKIGIKLAKTQINLNNDALLTNVVTRDNILSDTYKKYSEIITESTKQGLNIANTILANATADKIKAETFEQQWKNDFIEKFKVNPEYAQGVYGLVLQLCAETSNQIIDGIHSISLGNIGTKIKDGISNMPDPVKSAFYSLYNSSKENQRGIKGPHK